MCIRDRYSRLIARRVRESKVYCEIIKHTVSWEAVSHLNPKGVILSGGPASVYEPSAPLAPSWVFEHDLPETGICYGMQALVHQLGGKVAPSERREYGHAVLRQNDTHHPLFADLDPSINVWMSHGDVIVDQPPGFSAVAYTENSPVAATANQSKLMGIQFHPEVVHTPNGKQILDNFVHGICECSEYWTAANFVDETISNIRAQVGDGKVICALSGGVDSAVTAGLIHKAVGDQLTCVFVNNGLLRREEPERLLDLSLIHISEPTRPY